MNLVLRWQAVAQSHALAWAYAGAAYELAQPELPPPTIAAIVGPPGRDGDLVAQLDCGTF